MAPRTPSTGAPMPQEDGPQTDSPGYVARPDHSLRIIFGFLFCVAIALAALFYVSVQKPVQVEQTMNRFNRLQDVYRQEGIQKFLEAKSALKQDISHVLNTSTEGEALDQATNVAVYLFPDVLPKDDYERPVAESQWANLEEQIEKAPRTAQSRALFEELRANIWNYESPERVHPNLSATAKQVIRIYEELSAP